MTGTDTSRISAFEEGQSFSRPRSESNWDVKRLFDLSLAVLGVAVTAPVLLLIAALVKLDSRGPVFYRGRRTGLGGKEFRIFKFRTMVANAEKLGGYSTAKNDARITRVGGFLRRHKLDELPQLLNVLLGDMSFVGPRPEIPAYTALYEGEELLILTVRPGITDYASLHFIRLDEVLGEHNADAVYETNVRPIKNSLRVRYVKTRSFKGDFGLIAETLLRLIGVRTCSTGN